MTTTLRDIQAREAFVKADPSHAELERKAHEARDEASKVEGELMRLANKVQRLLYLRDVALQQMFKSEETSDETDNLLRDLTANDGECWHGMASLAVDDLLEQVLTLCGTIGEKHKHHKALELERKERFGLAWDKAKELRAIWDAMQEEKAEA